jgi:hypothetical protein
MGRGVGYGRMPTDCAFAIGCTLDSEIGDQRVHRLILFQVRRRDREDSHASRIARFLLWRQTDLLPDGAAPAPRPRAAARAISSAWCATATPRDPASWLKIKNPIRSQAVSRHEVFEGRSVARRPAVPMRRLDPDVMANLRERAAYGSAANGPQATAQPI